jgi:hypothetical protein
MGLVDAGRGPDRGSPAPNSAGRHVFLYPPTGASTNTGWFALIVALMCIPFGGLLLTLGVAKWLHHRSQARRG